MVDRDKMEIDVLFVGGGISSLSGAIHLKNLIKQHNRSAEEETTVRPVEDIAIAVLEKGAYIGAHNISGAIMIPDALKKLVADAYEDAPIEADVALEEMVLLTKNRSIKMPVMPPFLKNHSACVVSLSKLTEWLGDLAEENDVDIFPGFAGKDILYSGSRVIGIRTGDKGVGPDGNPTENYEPGIDLHAKVTVFGEGTRGSLTKTLIEKHGLDSGKNPQTYVVGIKEVWEVPKNRITPGQVIHTVGYPLQQNTYGGGFVYGMKNNMVSVGLIIGLNYKDPCLDPHQKFQKFKSHPHITKILKNGKLIQYGAKTAPVGGYWAIPKLVMDGAMLIGDAAGLFNSQKIKGIHIAIKSGMLAAETIFRSLLNKDFSASQLTQYEQALYQSDVGKELYKARNFHQAFQNGLYIGALRVALQYLMGGRDWKARLLTEEDAEQLSTIKAHYGTNLPTDKQLGVIKFDGTLSFDRETDAYYSGVAHEEHQASHLKIDDTQLCVTSCWEKYCCPCTRFCPAKVYELEKEDKTGKRKLKINFTNCLHCKACDVKDPFNNIAWHPPEGEGGPKYTLQ